MVLDNGSRLISMIIYHIVYTNGSHNIPIQ